MEEYTLTLTDCTIEYRPTVVAWNGVLACTPFKTTELTPDKTNKYFVTPENRNALEALTVLHGTAEIPAGSTVYVLASHKQSAWATPNSIVTFEGQQLIFVPIQDIRLVRVRFL
jgi:hypothetical protein